MNKLAMVVGISDYPENPLKNTVNDAEVMVETLDKLGIDTISGKNVGIAELKDILDEFKSKMGKYEVAIFFFAGHGMEIEGENYLCATDTDFVSLNRIKYTSLPLNLVIDNLENTDVYTKIIILDACRDNPFETRLRGAGGGNLATVFAPLGTIIAFATSPGQKASDGKGSNGAFTYSMLQHIYTNDLKIEEFFKRTRNTLYSITSQKQISWEHTSLMGDFFFSTAELSGDFDSNYDKDVLSDSSLIPKEDNDITEIIKDLKTSNWNYQNPAITKLRHLSLSEYTKNELFLLGRNIYQSGIGPAWSCASYLDNLESNLAGIENEPRFHLLNGILFEIYFDSVGRLRDRFKVDKIDIVYKVAFNSENSESRAFIYSKLKEYGFRVLFNPNQSHVSTFYVQCIKKDDSYFMEKILFESKNILFDAEGQNEFSISNEMYACDKERIARELVDRIGTPSFRMSILYLELPDDIERVNIPYDYKLLNFPLKSQME